jgi:hypothetical protein
LQPAVSRPAGSDVRASAILRERGPNVQAEARDPNRTGWLEIIRLYTRLDIAAVAAALAPDHNDVR